MRRRPPGIFAGPSRASRRPSTTPRPSRRRSVPPSGIMTRWTLRPSPGCFRRRRASWLGTPTRRRRRKNRVKLLLDEHVPPVLAEELRRRRPAAEVVALQDFEGRAYLGARDE